MAAMRHASVLLALAASACATSQAGAPISFGGAPAPAPVAEAPEPQAPAAPPVQAPPDWAAFEGPSLADFALRPEDVYSYDPKRPPRTYRPAPHESLYDIATRFQVPLRALIEQNRLEPPYGLPASGEVELPPPRLHRVAAGERLEDVARANNVDPRSLALLNRLTPPYAVRAGDELMLPALARPWAQSRPAAPAAVAEAPAPAGATRLLWPVRGEVVTRFGARAGGGRSDGIEIAAREGAPIAAAADGVVVYSGADLPGYGTLVLVRHEDGHVTAYGYARRSLTREGEAVRAGQAIGEVGRAGDGRALLLFQVRRGREAVDPAPLLP